MTPPEGSAAATRSPKETIRALEQVLAAHDLDRLGEFFTSDVAVHHPVERGTLHGLETLEHLISTIITAFPDWRLELHEVIENGERSAARFTQTGTHGGTFVGFAPTGGKIRSDEMMFYVFAGSKIAEIWIVTDVMRQMQHLGLMPEGPPPKPMLLLMSLMRRLRPRREQPALEQPDRGPVNARLAGASGPVAQTRDAVEVVFNGRDWGAAERYFAKDVVVHHSTLPEPIHGIDGFKALVESTQAGIPDWSLTIDEVVHEGDFVATRLTRSGTHTEPFAGFPPTGRRFAVSEAMASLFDGDHAREIWIVPSRLRQMIQLELMPDGPPPKPVQLLMRLGARKQKEA